MCRASVREGSPYRAGKILAEREVIGLSDPCVLARTWGVDGDVMRRVFRAAELFENFTRSPVWIISGYRTRLEQLELGRVGRQTAPDNLSTHRSCPATGIDISLGSLPSNEKKLFWGQMVEVNGLRWGGGSERDERGLPSDWQHVDRGPRPTVYSKSSNWR